MEDVLPPALVSCAPLPARQDVDSSELLLIPALLLLLLPALLLDKNTVVLWMYVISMFQPEFKSFLHNKVV